MSDLNLLVDFMFGLMTDVFNLLTSNWLLASVLALWLIRRVCKIFHLL